MVRSYSKVTAIRNLGGCGLCVAALFAAGCSYTSQTAKTHVPFVPPPPRPSSGPLLPEAPPISRAVPQLELSPALRENLQPPGRRKADAMAQRASLRFQRGKTLYQAGDFAH